MVWLKKWFKDSETILWARLQALAGFAIAAAGLMDWSPLVGLVSGGGFDRSQIIALAGVLFVQGVVTEVLRRLRAEDM